jgi:hypothetical protein
MTFIVDGSLGGTFPTWTTATRPATPATGQEGFNTTTGVLEVYNGSAWFAAGTITANVTAYTSGSGTYTTPTGAKYLVVQMVGGGGGGAGTGTPGSGGAGGAGGTTTFGSSFLTCTGGGGAGQPTAGNTSSVPTGGDINIVGSAGLAGPGIPNSIYEQGGNGGPSFFGGSNVGGYVGGAGNPGFSGSGGGGGGMTSGATSTGVYMGGGGGAGGYLQKIISNPSASYSYAVGAGGTAGTAGSTGYAGGVGGAGLIIVTAYF